MGTLIHYNRILGLDQDGELILEERNEKLLSQYKVETKKLVEEIRKCYPNTKFRTHVQKLFDTLIMANSKCDIERILVEYDRKDLDNEERYQNQKTSFWQKLFGH